MKKICKEYQKLSLTNATNANTYKCNSKEISHTSEKDKQENFNKNNPPIALNALYSKNKEKYILPPFQNTTQIVKNK